MPVIKLGKNLYKVNGIDNLVSELISYERAYNSYLKIFRKKMITTPVQEMCHTQLLQTKDSKVQEVCRAYNA